MLWADSGIWSSPQNVLPRGAVWRSCYGSGKVGGFILFLPFPHPQALPFHCSLGRCYLALFFVFIPDHEACGILLPWPGIKPVLPVVEAPSRNHWSTREVPISSEVAWPVTLLTLEWWPWCSESRVPWTQCHEEKGQKKMKDVLQVCISHAQQFPVDGSDLSTFTSWVDSFTDVGG